MTSAAPLRKSDESAQGGQSLAGNAHLAFDAFLTGAACYDTRPAVREPEWHPYCSAMDFSANSPNSGSRKASMCAALTIMKIDMTSSPACTR